MNRKYFVAIVVFTALIAGAFFLLRFIHGSGGAESPDEDEHVETVVTVQTGKLQRATLHSYVDGFGLVAGAPAEEGRPASSSDIASPVAGIVTAIDLWEGKTVQQGDLLIQLDSRVADVAVDFAEKNLARQQELLRLKDTSQKAAQDAEEQLAAAKAQQDLLRIRAPLSGTVTRVNVRPGEAVDLTTVLATIADLHRLVVNTEIPADEAAAIKVGQEAELETDPPARSSVVFVSPDVQASNGMVLLRLSAPEGLRPGRFLPVRIVTATRANCLAAPAESVVKNDEGQEVISIVTNSIAGQVPVTTGLRDGGLVEISVSGLREGEEVVTVGAYGLPEKTKIQARNP